MHINLSFFLFGFVGDSGRRANTFIEEGGLPIYNFNLKPNLNNKNYCGKY